MFKNAKFRIASVSKTFTAAGIILSEKRGLLSFSDKLSKYIPDFIQGDEITLRQLLLHQSGVADIEYDKLAMDGLSLDSVINTIKGKALYFKPGTQDRYSNSGYLLLAKIIEKVSGLNYAQFLEENIFSKLGMKNTGVDHKAKIISNKASGSAVGSGARGIALAAWYDIDLETGSGSIYSTTEDLLKWLKAIKNKTLFDITALEAPYGWGARVFFNDRRAIVQSGFLNGYTAYIACYPAEELYIIALSNISSNFNEDSGKDLAAIFFNQSYTLPPVRRTIPIEDLQVYTGKYSWPGYKDFLIEKKGDAIYWRFTDEKVGSPLAPVAKDVFILRLMNTRIMFKKDGTHVNALDFYQGKDATTCKRIE